MRELTSLADLHYRISKDDRYKILAVKAYRDSSYCPINYDDSYDSAINWIESWVENDKKTRIYEVGRSPTCLSMINFINKIMVSMPMFYGQPAIIPNTPINEPTTSNICS